MSGQWEVVSRKKDKGNKLALQPPREGKSNKKKNMVPKGPKVEEVLPIEQVKSLFKQGKQVAANKENKKVKEKAVVQENGIKKPQKKPAKPTETNKPKLHKSIESALTAISVDDFRKTYEIFKQQYSDAPFVRLNELARFLNQQVPVEINDPTFNTKPEGYPYSMVPSPIKSIIEKSLKEAGKTNVQSFFDISLTFMATEMSKGSPSLGYKFYLQSIALSDPKTAINSMDKHIELRNSYQNRAPVGLSILWAIGQAGLRDFQAGFKVFQELMLPLIEMKSYSKYVYDYLIALIEMHETSISKEQYLLILDTFYSGKKNLPANLNQKINKVVSKLNLLLLDKNTELKENTIIEPLLKKLSDNKTLQYQEALCDVLVTCLIRDPNSFTSWSKLYIKNLPQSAVLLNYIANKWNMLPGKLDNRQLRGLLNTFSLSNNELLLKKRKVSGLSECTAAIKALHSKMTVKKGSSFPYKKLFLLGLVIFTGFVYYDIKQAGSWQDSTVRKYLHHLKLCEYAHTTAGYVKNNTQQVHVYLHENYPEYYGKVVTFSEPYIELGRDLFRAANTMYENTKEVVVMKYPLVLEQLQSYTPGLVEQSQKAFDSAWSASVFYYNRSIDYLKNEVFVGQLSPENMQKFVVEAFNTTQQKATEYYHWLYEKVQTTMK